MILRIPATIEASVAQLHILNVRIRPTSIEAFALKSPLLRQLRLWTMTDAWPRNHGASHGHTGFSRTIVTSQGRRTSSQNPLPIRGLLLGTVLLCIFRTWGRFRVKGFCCGNSDAKFCCGRVPALSHLRVPSHAIAGCGGSSEDYSSEVHLRVPSYACPARYPSKAVGIQAKQYLRGPAVLSP